MMNGGKVLMATGFECISKGNLENVHKRVNDPEKSARLIGKVYSYGIMVFGLDNDPPDIFKVTSIADTRLHRVQSGSRSMESR